MKPQSAKAKGRNLQKWVVEYILDLFPTLTPRDVSSTSMGASGIDIKLSEAAIEKLPYAIECKNVEKINIWDSWEQCEANAKKEKLLPLLIFKRNRSKVLVVIELTTFMGFHYD